MSMTFVRPPLEITTRYADLRRFHPLWLIGLIPAVFLLVRGLLRFAYDPTNSAMQLLLGGGALLGMALLPNTLALAAVREAVRRFDERGVTLNNGRFFAWSDFVEVRAAYRAHGVVSHYTLVFRTGTTQVYFTSATNRQDIFEVIAALQQRINPWATPAPHT